MPSQVGTLHNGDLVSVGQPAVILWDSLEREWIYLKTDRFDGWALIKTEEGELLNFKMSPCPEKESCLD